MSLPTCPSCVYAQGICEKTGVKIRYSTGCTYHKLKPITNADRIRAMTDEELAMWLDNVCKSAYDEGYTKETDEPLMSPYPSIASEWLAWLKQEGE